jgi:DNA polymerase III delta prime subunit
MFDKQRKYFENLLRDGLLGHAYLFTGQDSAGKKSFAEDICTLLTGKGFENNPDLKFIYPGMKEDLAPSSSADPRSAVGFGEASRHLEKRRAWGGAGKYSIDIESIRDLKSFMYLKPHSSDYKLAVIENAEMTSIAAANAMLKILEEPPRNSVLVLISSKHKLLPGTILSRCETVVFPPAKEVETKEMTEALSELRKVVRQNMAERIQYAKKIHEKGDYAEIVNLWLRSLRLRLSDKPASAPVLKELLRLSHIVSQPQYNHRIALENFLVQL